jgi:hypothetical protein
MFAKRTILRSYENVNKHDLHSNYGALKISEVTPKVAEVAQPGRALG